MLEQGMISLRFCVQQIKRASSGSRVKLSTRAWPTHFLYESLKLFIFSFGQTQH